MKVYRIEDESGNGPFWGVADRMLAEDRVPYLQAMRKSFGECDRHPSPSAKMLAVDHILACTSLDQLAFWLSTSEAIKILKRYRFTVKVFKVKSVVSEAGNPQVAFHRKHASLVKILPLETLLTAV